MPLVQAAKGIGSRARLPAFIFTLFSVCVTLDKPLTLFKSQFSHLWNNYLWECSSGRMRGLLCVAQIWTLALCGSARELLEALVLWCLFLTLYRELLWSKNNENAGLEVLKSCICEVWALQKFQKPNQNYSYIAFWVVMIEWDITNRQCGDWH